MVFEAAIIINLDAVHRVSVTMVLCMQIKHYH